MEDVFLCELNVSQLQIMRNALDFYAYFITGDVDQYPPEVKRASFYTKNPFNAHNGIELQQAEKYYIKLLKKTRFNLDEHESYSFKDIPEAQIAFEMSEAVTDAFERRQNEIDLVSNIKSKWPLRLIPVNKNENINCTDLPPMVLLPKYPIGDKYFKEETSAQDTAK